MVPPRSIANEAEAGKIPLEIQSVPLNRRRPHLSAKQGSRRREREIEFFGESVIHIGQDWNAQIVELLKFAGRSSGLGRYSND